MVKNCGFMVNKCGFMVKKCGFKIKNNLYIHLQWRNTLEQTKRFVWEVSGRKMVDDATKVCIEKYLWTWIYIIQLKFLENGWRETEKNTTHYIAILGPWFRIKANFLCLTWVFSRDRWCKKHCYWTALASCCCQSLYIDPFHGGLQTALFVKISVPFKHIQTTEKGDVRSTRNPVNNVGSGASKLEAATNHRFLAWSPCISSAVSNTEIEQLKLVDHIHYYNPTEITMWAI